MSSLREERKHAACQRTSSEYALAFFVVIKQSLTDYTTVVRTINQRALGSHLLMINIFLYTLRIAMFLQLRVFDKSNHI